MTLFEKLYGAGKDVLQAALRPSKAKAINRAFEAYADDVESKRINAESNLEELRHALANADGQETAEDVIAQIIAIQIDLEEAERIAAMVAKEKDTFFGEVKE